MSRHGARWVHKSFEVVSAAFTKLGVSRTISQCLQLFLFPCPSWLLYAHCLKCPSIVFSVPKRFRRYIRVRHQDIYDILRRRVRRDLGEVKSTIREDDRDH